tara:strand:- start:185 stop:808 length:624 start_codon:yes stop_codon:yes gene_type:complete
MDLFDDYSHDELLLIPVKNLGLKRQPWTFTRGMMVSRDFLDENDDLRVCVEYTYTFSADNRIAHPSQRTIKWFKIDGTIGLQKTDELTYSVKDLKHEQRKVRQGQIDYMIAAGEELAILADAMPEPYKTSYTQAAASVDDILSHYEIEIDHYIKRGAIEFEDAVRNETDPTILTKLALMVRPPDAQFSAGLTIEQTILHQLTGEYNP